MNAIAAKMETDEAQSSQKPELSLRVGLAIFTRHIIVVAISFIFLWTVFYLIISGLPTDWNSRRILEYFQILLGGILISGSVLVLSWVTAWFLSKKYPKFGDLSVLNPLDILQTRSDRSQFQKMFDDRRTLDPNEARLAERLTVLTEIDVRVESLRRRTSTILATMGLALLGAALVAIFAGRLTSIDATAVSNIDRIKSEVTDQTRNLTRLYEFQSLYTQLETERKTSVQEADRIERQIANIRGFQSAGPPDLQSAIQLVVSAEKQLAKLNELADDAWKRELASERGYNDWRYIVATAITRVGVILIIVFLVQILLGLYRYNMRLIAYYNAHRDMLTVWDGSPEMLDKLNSVLSAPKIDFGKEPKHPLEDILRMVGEKIDAALPKSQKSEPQK